MNVSGVAISETDAAALSALFEENDTDGWDDYGDELDFGYRIMRAVWGAMPAGALGKNA